MRRVFCFEGPSQLKREVLPAGIKRSSQHKRSCVFQCVLIQKSKKARISSALVLLKLYMIYRITENGPMDKVFFGWIFTFNYIIANMMEIMAGYYHIGVI